MEPDYSPIPDSALIMLAGLILKRTRLSLPASTREQAIRVIRSVRPAPSLRVPLSSLIKSKTQVPLHPDMVCGKCGKRIPYGTLCKTIWTMYDGEHINCQEAA